MKITITYDNEAYRTGFVPDWGFSCLIEREDLPRILFDTGANGKILLQNMKGLGIDPRKIPEVFISHGHHDHMGGLSNLLRVNSEAKVYLPASVPKPAGARRIVAIKDPIQIHEGVFSTGKLKEIEQSLVIREQQGLVVMVGCSHPGVGTILEAASQFGKVYALVGGLHGFREFELLQDLGCVCPTHCTAHTSEIKVLYPEKFIQDGVGRVIEL